MKYVGISMVVLGALAGCMKEEGMPIEQAVQIEKAQAGPGLATVISEYKAGNFAAAFNALPDQGLANRMRSSSGVASIAAANGEYAK